MRNISKLDKINEIIANDFPFKVCFLINFKLIIARIKLVNENKENIKKDKNIPKKDSEITEIVKASLPINGTQDKFFSKGDIVIKLNTNEKIASLLYFC